MICTVVLRDSAELNTYTMMKSQSAGEQYSSQSMEYNGSRSTFLQYTLQYFYSIFVLCFSSLFCHKIREFFLVLGTFWLKSRANWDALAAECDAINVTAILRSENSMRALNHVLLEACNRHIPRKTILLCTIDQPWFDESCRRAHHRKQTLFHVWRRNWSQLNYLNFSEARREANRIFHEAEKRYNQKLKTQLQEVTQDHLW